MSRRQSDAELNYHVGDLELLAVKLTLEEWHHLLEGLSTLSRFSRTTRTWNISSRLSG